MKLNFPQQTIHHHYGVAKMNCLMNCKRIFYPLFASTFAFTAFAPDASANLVGLWDFDNPTNLGEATIGNDLVQVNSNGTIAAATGITAGDGAVSVGLGDYFEANPDIAANGGGSFVNEYTFVWDVYLPTSSDATWRSLYQTNDANGNDGDYFIAAGDNTLGVGALGYTSTALPADNWYRIILSYEASAPFAKVFDESGTEIIDIDLAAQSTDGRFSLYTLTNDPQVLLFADDNGDDNEIVATSVAIFDTNLSKSEASALGAPGTAIPEPTSLALVAIGAGLVMSRRRRGD